MIRSRTVVIRSFENIQLQQTINQEKTLGGILEGRRCLNVLFRSMEGTGKFFLPTLRQLSQLVLQ
ncbi:Conserved hypothetical protein [Prochlorococcus marinus str. MIT 9303]|uniref:Uncharacterized protein n=1 Tax=Prochlorococcus marinus (strain MIT 9303) TaxID=59922 RepID=A2C940_PROM3|nr:Conserved hypothetical protein [Prochlorococcus marinus str. MIT 9303]